MGRIYFERLGIVMKQTTLVAREIKGLFFILALLLCQFGCGKFGPALPPESFSAQPVKELIVNGEIDGIHFSWKSPEDDLHGERLKSLDEYKIYRKEIIKSSDVLDSELEFELLGTVPDNAITDLELRRKQALDAGQSARKVRIDPEFISHEFIDTTVEPGSTYLYKIVGVNQGGVEGRPAPLVRVAFKGQASVIDVVNRSTFEEILDDESGELL